MCCRRKRRLAFTRSGHGVPEASICPLANSANREGQAARFGARGGLPAAVNWEKSFTAGLRDCGFATRIAAGSAYKLSPTPPRDLRWWWSPLRRSLHETDATGCWSPQIGGLVGQKHVFSDLGECTCTVPLRTRRLLSHAHHLVLYSTSQQSALACHHPFSTNRPASIASLAHAGMCTSSAHAWYRSDAA